MPKRRDLDSEPTIEALEDRASAWQAELFDLQVRHEPTADDVRVDQARQLIADFQLVLAHSVAAPAVPVSALRALLETWIEHENLAADYEAAVAFMACVKDLAVLCDQAEQP